VEELIFAIIAAATLLFSLAIFLEREIMHSAVFFAASMLLIGGIYVLLGAYFLAFMHVMVYVGAVAVLMVFAIMVTKKGGMNEL
jgi:NADH-quinone oxidoreductase subunit J